MLNLSLSAKFPVETSQEEINNQIRSRLRNNIAKFCPTCRDVAPVFYNLEKQSMVSAKMRRRRSKPSKRSSSRLILQTLSSDLQDYTGSVSVMLSYQQDNNQVLFSDVFRSLLGQSYTDQVDTSEELADVLESLQQNQIVVSKIDTSWDSRSDSSWNA